MTPQTVIPYLTVNSAADAIAFYQRAFGATEEMRLPEKDGKRIMHAQLNVNGGSVYLSDEFRDHDGPIGPINGPKPPVGVLLQFAAPADVDAIYERAVAAGATGGMAPADQFWGARFAMLTDPFGHRWMFNAPLPKG